MVKSK